MLILFIIISLTFTSNWCFAQNGQNHFTSGEKLKFIIYFGIIDAGMVEAELNSLEDNDIQVYHGKMHARTIGLADKLFKVRDEYEGFFYPLTILPIKSIRNISEGRYKRYYVDIFDHSNRKVTTLKGEVFEISPETRDMVSVFFYIRNIDYSVLNDGDIIKITTFFDNEIFPFDIRYRGTEKIKTKSGVYHCIKLVPFVEPGRIFNKEDDMTIWLSNDLNRVPVRVKFDLKVGSIKCDIIEFSGLKH